MSNTTKSLFSSAAKSALAAAMALSMASAAIAGDKDYSKSALMDWAKGAGQAVDDVMVYPSYAVRRGYEGKAEFRVTVNSEGDVIRSSVTDAPKSIALRRAAERVVTKMALPDLPEGYEQLTFALRLTYDIAAGPLDEAQFKRRPTVTTRRIARADDDTVPLLAGLRVLSATRSTGSR